MPAGEDDRLEARGGAEQGASSPPQLTCGSVGTMDPSAPDRAQAAAHELFQDRLKAELVRAGLPIAATWDSTLSPGIWLEVIDGSTLPSAFLEWRVHPTLVHHLLSLRHDELPGDFRVRAMRNTQRAMHTAITSILEFAGYRVREARSERAGELIVTRAEPPAPASASPTTS